MLRLLTWKPRSTGYPRESSVRVWPPKVASFSKRVTRAPALLERGGTKSEVERLRKKGGRATRAATASPIGARSSSCLCPTQYKLHSSPHAQSSKHRPGLSGSVRGGEKHAHSGCLLNRRAALAKPEQKKKNLLVQQPGARQAGHARPDHRDGLAGGHIGVRKRHWRGESREKQRVRVRPLLRDRLGGGEQTGRDQPPPSISPWPPSCVPPLSLSSGRTNTD